MTWSEEKDQIRRKHDRVFAENRDMVRARLGGERAVQDAEVELRAIVARDAHAASGGSTSYATYLKNLAGDSNVAEP